MNIKPKQRKKLKGGNFGIFLALILMIVIFSVLNNRFFTINNAVNIIRQVSLNGIMACGMTCVIVCGGIDLSIGATYALSGMMTGVFLLNGIPPVAAIVLGLFIGIACGIANGLIATKLLVPPMITTLATQFIFRGMALVITDGGIVNLKTATNASTYNAPVAALLELGSGQIGGVFPNMAAVFIVVAVVMCFFYHKTTFGFNMRAVGGNKDAAKVCGIKSDQVQVMSFALMGFLSALSGIINITYLGSVQGTMGEGIEMDIIAASIIGGTSLTGGSGSIPGTIIGVFIYGVMKAGLVYIGITSYMQQIFIGAIIIFAVTVDMMTKRHKR